MGKETGGPAFAASGHPGQQFIQQEGMALRDYLAAKAMQGILANHHMIDSVTPDSAKWLAREAYQVAEAMLAARDINNLQEV